MAEQNTPKLHLYVVGSAVPNIVACGRNTAASSRNPFDVTCENCKSTQDFANLLEIAQAREKAKERERVWQARLDQSELEVRKAANYVVAHVMSGAEFDSEGNLVIGQDWIDEIRHTRNLLPNEVDGHLCKLFVKTLRISLTEEADARENMQYTPDHEKKFEVIDA